MKFIVTGGAGFIGSNIVRRLVNDGNEVLVVDNLSTGNRENLKQVKIEKLTDRIDYIEIGKIDVDGVFHLGMPSSSPMYRANPHLVDETIKEAITLLEILSKTGVPVVLASTSSLYNGNSLPYNEEMNIKVSDYYTETRYAIERLFEYYSNNKGLKYSALRLFSVYGESELYKGIYANLVYQFLTAMKEGISPVLYGDGSQRRDFIYQGDVVNSFLKAMKTLLNGDEIPKVVNVGTGVNYSLVELVELINQALGSEVKPVFKDVKIPGYVDATLADCGLMNQYLGGSKVDLPGGIRKVLLSLESH